MKLTWPRRRVILAAGVAALALGTATTILTGGNYAVGVATQATVFAALFAYFVAYKRERGEPLSQFTMRGLMVVLTFAALEAWATRAGGGNIVFAMLLSGSLLYWRLWIRRHDTLNWFSLLLLWLLILWFGLSVAFFALWMCYGPPVDYSVPITEQQQGVILRNAP